MAAQTGQLLETSITEARKLAATARRRARGRGTQAKLKAAGRLEKLADRCEKVCSQIRQRVAGEPIKDRLIQRRAIERRIAEHAQAAYERTVTDWQRAAPARTAPTQT